MIKNYTNFINENQNKMVFGGKELVDVDTIDEMVEKLKEFENIKYNDYIILPQSTPVVMCTVYKLTKLAKFGFKVEFSNTFRNGGVDAMVKHLSKFFNDKIERKERSDKRAEERRAFQKEQKSNIKNIIKIGDIFYESYGYNETHVTFYQVVDVTEKGTVSLKVLEYETVEGTETRSSANVRPIKDDFLSDEIIKKRATFYGKNVYLGSGHLTLHRYTSGDKGVHSSWDY